MPSAHGYIQSATPDSDLQQRIPIKNVGASEIPAFGLVEITGIEFDDVFGRSIITVQRPTADSGKLIAVNAEFAVPVDAVGFATVTFPTWVLYDDADGTPALNEQWGPANGTYLAKKSKIGLLGIPMSSGDSPPVDGVRLFMQEVCRE